MRCIVNIGQIKGERPIPISLTFHNVDVTDAKQKDTMRACISVVRGELSAHFDFYDFVPHDCVMKVIPD